MRGIEVGDRHFSRLGGYRGGKGERIEVYGGMRIFTRLGGSQSYMARRAVLCLEIVSTHLFSTADFLLRVGGWRGKSPTSFLSIRSGESLARDRFEALK